MQSRTDFEPSSLVPSSGDDEADVAELLRQLESADGIAKGVETRLDDIIGNLDNLLASLESSGHARDPPEEDLKENAD